MSVFRDKREGFLLIAAIAALGLIVLINLKLSVWPWFDGGAIAVFLRAEPTASVSNDLLVGLFSAYVFYVFVELLPRNRKEQLTLTPLNLIIASIVNAFEEGSVFAHETPITSIGLQILTIDNIKADIKSIISGPDLLNLKAAMETAHSRYPDFQHCLPMAASISPAHALAWLVLTDKVRLLAEEYDLWPVSPFKNNLSGEPEGAQQCDTESIAEQVKHKGDILNATYVFRQRVMEFLEATLRWLELNQVDS